MPRLRYEALIPIPAGNAGVRATLERMTELICAPEPLVAEFIAAHAAAFELLEECQVAQWLFEWVRARMLYYTDLEGGGIVEEIKTPAALLTEIARHGAALGDCDDYVILLGAFYHALDFPVTLVAVSTRADRELEHVYLRVETDIGPISADAIVPEPFGWELPESDVTNRLEIEA